VTARAIAFVFIAAAIAAAGDPARLRAELEDRLGDRPGQRLGALNLSDSERDLGARYGAQNVPPRDRVAR
jgi:hypothetical protein